MLLTFEEDKNTFRCRFAGELNSDRCSEIESELATAITRSITAEPSRRLVFDLSGVPYISSAFLRLCLFYCKKLGTEKFAIEGASSDLKKVFEIAGFTELMKVS
ncbi:MAG: STAS domain-containing protein [Thermoguttaceae bacterium]